MPNSSPKGKRETHEWFGLHSEIKTVVDVGCGQGTYPKLLKDKDIKWIGIEVYEPYIEQFKLKELYDEIIIGDILTCDWPDADCIIFGDILEHLEKKEAQRVLRKAEEKYNNIVVSIPIDYPQKANGDNKYEAHKTLWTERELGEQFKDYSIKKTYGNIGLFILNGKKDKTLFAYFAWGRGDLVEKSFESLLETIRPQDKLLVIDQEMQNFEYFAKHRDRIDFLTFFKMNYSIGPIWVYIRNFLMWKRDIREAYLDDSDRIWYPNYISIVESDAVGKKGWINRLIEVFNMDDSVLREKAGCIGIVSGYDGLEHPPREIINGIKFKKRVCGVQALFKTDYFIDIANFFEKTGQDTHVSIKNKINNKLIAVLPNEIEHIGVGRRSSSDNKEI